MPKIHKIEFIEEEVLVLEEKKSQKFYRSRNPLEVMMDGCLCNDFEISHNENGICGLVQHEMCDCTKFTPRNFEIVVEITEIDRFEFEVKDHSERDSFAWHNELESWRRINETKNTTS